MVAGIRSGFRYVLDAFCAINASEVPVTFFRKGVNPILLRVSYDRLGQTFIASHHPLRETLIAQTGTTPEARWNFLKKADKVAGDYLPGERWRCEQRGDSAF